MNGHAEDGGRHVSKIESPGQRFLTNEINAIKMSQTIYYCSVRKRERCCAGEKSTIKSRVDQIVIHRCAKG